MKKCKYRQNSFEVEVSYEVVRVWHYREHRGAKKCPLAPRGVKSASWAESTEKIFEESFTEVQV